MATGKRKGGPQGVDTLKTLEELYVEQLKDLYSAEDQIIDALPKMIDAVSDDELRDALEQHLEVTREQQERLDQIFGEMGKKPGGHECKGMKGLIEEGEEMLKKGRPGPVMDAGIIASDQRVEHYEIAGYGTARALAEELDHGDAADLLEQTLDEEGDADEKLNRIAQRVNEEARKSRQPAGAR